MKRLASALAVGLVLALGAVPARSQGPTSITVYKSPTCGCCNDWIAHLEDNGFEVTSHDVPDVGPIKQKHGVPRSVGSCHTALVDGFVIEGHVPASDVKRLLSERPAVAGLAVPGMPIGSPGMEGPDPERYHVLSFGPDGKLDIFASHGP
jgi:hypothetical protein